MKAENVYHTIKAIANQYHAHDDQMVAIAKWVEQEFDHKPGKKVQDPKCEEKILYWAKNLEHKSLSAAELVEEAEWLLKHVNS